jgi:AraC-like DNA-binding protein
MAKPKRFNSAKDFELQINRVIEELIDNNNLLPELERKDLQVADIAVKFSVSTNTLRRWCKEYTNISARECLAVYRVERAKSLLLTGYKPSDVAAQLAFADHKTFSTVFKRYAGKSPSSYVKPIFSADSPYHTKFNK